MSDEEENTPEVEETPEQDSDDESPWDRMRNMVKEVMTAEFDAREEKWQERQRANSTSLSPKQDSKKVKSQSLGRFHEAFFGTRAPKGD